MQNKIILLFMIVGMLFTGSTVLGDELTAGYDENAPFHFSNQNGKVVGIDADILREALADIGFSLQFEELPWSRILWMVETGELDIAIGAKYTDERSRFAHYSNHYKSIQHWLYTREGEYRHVRSLKDFLEQKNVVLGIMTGWGYPPEIAKLINDKKYETRLFKGVDLEQLLLMIDSGRIEGIIFTPETLEVMKNEIGIEVSLVPRARYEERLHFLFSKESVHLDIVARFNSALEKLIKNGRMKELTEKYK